MGILHKDRKQALRIRRALLGLVAYLMWIMVALYLYTMNLVQADFSWFLGYFTLIFLTNLSFVMAIRLDWNLRFQDPGMTLAQIGFGILWGMVLLSQTVPEARGGVLLVFVTGFFFGVFRLTTREFLFLTAFASLTYAGLIRYEWQGLDANTRLTEMSQWVFLTIVLLWMSFMGGYVARLRANLRKAMGQIEELANRDHLTGTNNRRAITGRLDLAIKAAQEEGDLFSIAMLDLDHFKQLNDQYGHLSGDAVLKDFVHRVEEQLRRNDFINDQNGEPLEGQAAAGEKAGPDPLGRFGGEEFLVVLPGTEAEGARQAAERIRDAVERKPFEAGESEIPVTVSIGVAQWEPGDTAESLLRRADRSLYKAKADGRNRVVVW